MALLQPVANLPLNPINSATMNNIFLKIFDPRHRLIVALDVSTAAAARKIVAAVGDSAQTYKVGMQLYTAEGPSIVRELVGSGRRVFLDLKYHDIPNTVGERLFVKPLTAWREHVDRSRLRWRQDAARRRRGRASESDGFRLVLAVTVLTSLDEVELGKIGLRGRVVDQVLRLTALALSNGCQGVIGVSPRSRRDARGVRQRLRDRDPWSPRRRQRPLTTRCAS